MQKILHIIILLFICQCVLAQAFFPYSFENKWGAVDSKGNIIIEAIYDNIPMPPPNDNNAVGIFQQDGKYGIINNKAKVLLSGLDFIDYDGNGDFVWYYDNPSNYSGLHLYGIQEQKELGFYNDLRVKHKGVIGYKTKFITLVGEKNKHILINEKGAPVITANDIYRGFNIDYMVNDCPMLSYVIVGRKSLYFDCTGQAMTEDEYLEKYGSPLDQDYPDFLDQSVYEPAKNLESYSTLYPDYELVKIIKSKHSQTESILAKKNGSYGILNFKGDIVLAFEYSSINLYDNFLLLRKHNLMGAARLDGKLILASKYAMINKNSQDHGYIRVLTKSGYWGFANVWGKLYLPTGVDEE